MDHTSIMHTWDVSPTEAIEIQRELRSQVILTNSASVSAPKTIAGVDASYQDKNGEARAAIVVLRFPDLTLVDQVVATCPISFPYVPGLLSFREGPTPAWRVSLSASRVGSGMR
jgi:deoxyribonuclease V